LGDSFVAVSAPVVAALLVATVAESLLLAAKASPLI